MTDPQDKLSSLRKWADRLRDENATMAAELAGYADAWEAERARIADLERALRYEADMAAQALERIAEQDEEIARLRAIIECAEKMCSEDWGHYPAGTAGNVLLEEMRRVLGIKEKTQ